MASSALKTTAILITLNLVFFTLVSSDPLPEASTRAINGLQFGVCASMLNNLLHGGFVGVGTPQASPCCDLFFGLAELEAATCLCKAIKANLLGFSLDASASLSLLFNHCEKGVPSGFQCA